MENRLLRSKAYLYMTAFFAGMAIMAVELGASRLLAPYFSSSQIVWTIIIGTIMIAMALGNVWGGRRADRDPDPGKLYGRIIIAACWIAAIPVVGKYIIIGITGLLVVSIETNLLIWAAFLACMVLFVFPLFLLGTVTPSLVKYSVGNLNESGRVVGMLGASNTIGSILGTFLPTFVTIPTVGTAITFLIFSGILMALGVVYFVVEKSRLRLVIIGLIVFVGCSIFGHSDRFAFWEDDLTYEGESIYNYLQVRDATDRTILSTNVLFGVQSVKMKKDRLTGMYYDYAMMAPVLAGAKKGSTPKILVLGMGTGTFAGMCREFYPRAQVQGVEIDEKITNLAHTYFDLPPDIPVTTYDGRAYLQADEERYDVIMVDAYQDITIPFQMSTTEFFALVREHLNPGGVMVVNLNMHSEEAGSINVYLSDTVASKFGQVWTVDVPRTTNRELFAMVGNNGELRDQQIRQQPAELQPLLVRVAEGMTAYQPGELILTDDQAPVEWLGMKAMDGLIQDELFYYKDKFRQDGIGGLLEGI